MNQQQRNNNPKTSNTLKNRQRRIRKNKKKKEIKQTSNTLKTIMSKCTREYAAALVNPFGSRHTMPCVPDNIVMPSFKIQTKVRGVFSTGTLGFGFVVLNPWQMLTSDNGFGPTSVNSPVVFTTATYNASFYSAQVAGGTFTLPGLNAQNSNSDLNVSFVTTQQRQMRLVAAGLRCQYIGSTFRNQGRVILASQQGNSNFLPGTTGSTLLLNNYNISVPVSRKSEYVFYKPDSHDLLSYQDYNNYLPSVSALPDRKSLLIYVEGGDIEVPQSFEFEAVAYFEVIGPNLTLSTSHSDPSGLGATLSSLPVRNPTAPPKEVEETVFQKIFKEISEQSINIVTEASRKLPGLAFNYASNYLAGQRMHNEPTIEWVD